MENIAVSIIVPVYNVEKYVGKCLESLINQSLKDIEIICINDGSTDNSLKILEKYAQKDSRIIVINQENKGVGSARNRGLQQAQGTYIGFVDPDDWVDLDFYESLYNESQNGAIDIIKGNFDMVFDNGKIESTEEQKNIQSELEKSDVPLTSFYSAWFSAIYVKRLIDKYKINFPETQYLEDIAFLNKMLYVSSNFKLASNSYYHYFMRNNSLTKKNHSFEMYKHMIASRKDVADFINTNVIHKEKYLFFFNEKVIGTLQYTLMNLVCHVGLEDFDYFANIAFDIIASCKYQDDLAQLRNDEFFESLKKKDTKRLKKYLFSLKPKLEPIKRIFSVRNWGTYKYFTILGLEFKIPLKIYRKIMGQGK